MTTKFILLTGVSEQSTEDGIRKWMLQFGQVLHVEFIREGDAANRVAVVEMEISDAQAFFIVSRVSDYWHEGALVSARILIH